MAVPNKTATVYKYVVMNYRLFTGDMPVNFAGCQ